MFFSRICSIIVGTPPTLGVSSTVFGIHAAVVMMLWLGGFAQRWRGSGNFVVVRPAFFAVLMLRLCCLHLHLLGVICCTLIQYIDWMGADQLRIKWSVLLLSSKGRWYVAMCFVYVYVVCLKFIISPTPSHWMLLYSTPACSSFCTRDLP